ncbi:OmpA family protein [Aliarcobacter butzleri]|uniref:OmpA family protein n=1 Tax=Aliarcobacter butzleri TaxID=28197 RepID=UPI0021B2DD99|nr:OmpA family protein [Aliarcobacter butzleri]MCT7646837.1 OmpA family protein [Aliarcobacter butzleri]
MKNNNFIFGISISEIIIVLFFLLALLSSFKMMEKNKSLNELEKKMEAQNEIIDLIKLNDSKLNKYFDELVNIKMYLNEIEKLKNELNSLKEKIKNKELLKIKNEELLNEIRRKEELLKKLTNLENAEDIKKLLENKIDEILAIEEQKRLNTELNTELNKTKQTIEKLTSVKHDVVSKLREKLGDKIEVDPKSGTLRISGNILFRQGEFELIEESKLSLKNILTEYIKVLIEDDYIKRNLDRIIIEGHTNSDGDYLFNLELSQKRALSVMKFLLELNPKFENDLKKFVTANGRSETDLIYNTNEEDKFASRRIEVKFRLKNEELINNISEVLKNK